MFDKQDIPELSFWRIILCEPMMGYVEADVALLYQLCAFPSHIGLLACFPTSAIYLERLRTPVRTLSERYVGSEGWIKVIILLFLQTQLLFNTLTTGDGESTKRGAKHESEKHKTREEIYGCVVGRRI